MEDKNAAFSRLNEKFEEFKKGINKFPPSYMSKNELWALLLEKNKEVENLREANVLLLKKINQSSSISVDLKKQLEKNILDIQIQMGMGTDKFYFHQDVCDLLEPIQQSVIYINEELQAILLREQDILGG